MSSFFTLPASQRKRKRTETRSARPAKKRDVETDGVRADGTRKSAHRQERDEILSGSESENEYSDQGSVHSESSADEDETAAEKRLRLAQRYLDNIKEDFDEAGFDAKDVDRDLIAARLKQDADEAKGRQYRLIATSLDLSATSRTAFRADTQSTTGVAIYAPFLYSVSKDKTLIKWQLIPPSSTETADSDASDIQRRRRKPKQLKFVKGVRIDASSPQQHGHTAAILAVAASPNGEYVATSGADRQLIIWAADTLKPLKTFTSHRDQVTGLSFAPSSSQPGVGSQLFTTSMDRTLKTYSLNGIDSLAYVETLFGHQDHVLDVAALAQDQCVSVGARDRSARVWKVVDETQLVFRGDSSKKDPYTVGSIDCVAAIPPTHFVTGSDAGTISLWSMHKKKPLHTIHAAHGTDDPEPFEKVTSESDPSVIADLKRSDRRRPLPRAITALASIPGTDLIVSGSWDGTLRLWKFSDDKRTIAALGHLGASNSSSHTLPNPDKDQQTALETGHHLTNGVTSEPSDSRPNPTSESAQPIPGVINSIAVLERRKPILNEFGGQKDGETQGVCVVVGTGKELRLGRWKKFKEGKNGCIAFEIPVKRR
ncbi:putative rrna processing protein rrp9 [Phaeomoniella chlamydospora]|uniref:Putative rrna processing protein rrp9 n=1 Tax=Phaeomoniella chlamydospora TaxID=158046 RepID=A0A0G2HL30_PHACM|nr:putative rrna processing protein rrp9 [Phaeomoniella chlamydospora]